jgi:hypothetical protein
MLAGNGQTLVNGLSAGTDAFLLQSESAVGQQQPAPSSRHGNESRVADAPQLQNAYVKGVLDRMAIGCSAPEGVYDAKLHVSGPANQQSLDMQQKNGLP